MTNIEEHIFFKDTIKDKWCSSSAKEVLSNMEFTAQVLPPKMKAIIPAFGFDKKVGSRSNKQLFPTYFVILELDTPPQWKSKIKAGCIRTRAMAQAQIEQIYYKLHYSAIPYYWMYMTPSTCGLRFVLQTNQPVLNEVHYKQVVLNYLRMLYRITYGKLNIDYHDIRVHQAWFVPTFKDRFSRKEEINEIAAYRPEPVVKKTLQQYTNANTQEDFFLRAIRFTERNFTYQEGSRNNFIHHLACNCNRFGIEKSDTEQWINSQFDLDEREIRATVQSAYRNNLSEFRKFIN